MIGLVVETTALALVVGALASSALGLRKALYGRGQEQALQRIASERYKDRVKSLAQSFVETSPAVPVGWRGFRKFYIERKVEEAIDIQSIYLRPYDGKPIPGYLPGQHVTIRFRTPDRVKPVVRCYSLSDSPDDSGLYRITVKRLRHPDNNHDAPEGLASNYIHDVLREGHIVELLAPSGHFHLDPSSDRPAVLIAGGIGITPLLSMLNAICATNRRREVWLFYSLRNRRDHAMYFHLKRLQSRYDSLRIIVCYSRPTETCVLGRDYDHEGRITIDLVRANLEPVGCQFYVCGPSAMQQDLVQGLGSLGVPESDIHVESFGMRLADAVRPNSHNGQALRAQQSGINGENVIALSTAAKEDAGHEIVFARSGKVGRWLPGDANLLHLAETIGVPMETGCRAGQCGSCAVALKEGEVDYLVSPAQTPESGACLPCIAVPKSGLVLDA